MRHHLQHVWKKHGFKGFYRATPAVCIGINESYIKHEYIHIKLNISFAGSVKEGVHFMIYEHLKYYLVPWSDENLPSGTGIAIPITSGIA